MTIVDRNRSGSSYRAAISALSLGASSLGSSAQPYSSISCATMSQFVAATREVLIELPADLIQPLRRVKDPRTYGMCEFHQHRVVVLAVVGHPHQALPRRREQQHPNGRVDHAVGGVQEALPLRRGDEPRVQAGVRILV